MFSFFKKLDLYLAKSFFLRFLGTVFFSFIFCYMNVAVTLLKRTQAVGSFLKSNALILLKVPPFLGEFLPYCILGAAASLFFSHAKRSEIVIMRAIGLSVWRILCAPLVIVILISLCQISIFDWLATKAQRLSYRLEQKDSSGSFSLSTSNQGLWLREIDKKNDITTIISIQTYDERQKLFYNPIFFIFKDRDIFSQRIEAQEGKICPDKNWHLSRVHSTKNGEATQNMPHLLLPTSLTNAAIENHFSDPNLISFFALPKFIHMTQKIGFSTREYEIRFYTLLFSPILNSLMVLIAAIFTLRFTARHYRFVMRNIALASIVGFFIFFFKTLCLTLSHNNFLPPFLGPLLPSIVFLLLSLWALFHLEDG